MRLVSPDHTARRRRRHEVREIASAQDGVLSRPQLLELGLTRWEIDAELRAERWRAHGRQTIAVDTRDLDERALLWFAVFESGPSAVLDGVAALVAAGLTGYVYDTIRVSVPRGARVTKRRGVDTRQTRRLVASDVIGAGLPRVRPEVAAVRAALWAITDRQAALLLMMPVQQGLATPESIGAAFLAVRRHRRRRFIETVITDMLDGVRAMGELDFARLCRDRDLPEPERQVLRQGSRGRMFLDARWSRWGVVAEIDGVQHSELRVNLHDALRQNDIVLGGDIVLRLPLLGLRVAPDEFFQQIERALVSRGWSRLRGAAS
jgi:very-short-patch-repair endonuclease